MLDRRELHGYRDGADWKFKVGGYRAAAKRAGRRPAAAEDEDGDVLLSEVELGRLGPRHFGHGHRRREGQAPRPTATSAWPTAT